MNVYLVSDLGYPVEGDEPEALAVFTEREDAERLIFERSKGYLYPGKYAAEHFTIKEIPLDPA